MEATVLILDERNELNDYRSEPNPAFEYNSFTDFQRTAIGSEANQSARMKSFSFAKPRASK